MSSVPTTTVRVTFGQSTGQGDSYLSAEIDGRDDGLNGGKTSFSPGSEVWFLVHRGRNVQVESVDASAGSAAMESEIEYIKEEDVVFEGEKSANLSMPSLGIVSTRWMGRSLGNVTLGADAQTLTADTSGLAVARVSYKVRALTGKLSSPSELAGEKEFTVAVLITGAVTAG